MENNLIETLHGEVRESEAYKDAVRAFYDNANIAAFSAFHIPPETLQELAHVVSFDWVAASLDGTPTPFYERSQDLYHQVDEFKRLLGISEMLWLSYRYIQSDENRGDKNG